MAEAVEGCNARSDVACTEREHAVCNEPLSELDNDGELIDEEVVGRMDDDGDEVKVALGGEVLVEVVATVLAKGTLQLRAGGLREADDGEDEYRLRHRERERTREKKDGPRPNH